MKLTRTSNWYSPFYFITTDEKHGGELDRISVFDDDTGEILALARQGWFGSNNRLDKLELPCDLIYKREFKPIAGTAIVTPFKDSYHDKASQLFLPNSVIKLSASSFRPYLGEHEAFLEERHSMEYPGVEFEMIHWINSHLNKLKSERTAIIEEDLKHCYYDTKRGSYAAARLLDKYIEISAEELRLANITVEDFLAHYYVKGGWAK